MQATTETMPPPVGLAASTLMFGFVALNLKTANVLRLTIPPSPPALTR
jgi:hypothetical protein